jgi:hypothetical protein
MLTLIWEEQTVIRTHLTNLYLGKTYNLRG